GGLLARWRHDFDARWSFLLAGGATITAFLDSTNAPALQPTVNAAVTYDTPQGTVGLAFVRPTAADTQKEPLTTHHTLPLRSVARFGQVWPVQLLGSVGYLYAEPVGDQMSSALGVGGALMADVGLQFPIRDVALLSARYTGQLQTFGGAGTTPQFWHIVTLGI